MCKRIYITGIAATGKTTLTKEFLRRGIFAFAIDELPGLGAWVNRNTKQKVDISFYQANRAWLEAHAWTCEVSKLKSLLATDTDLIIATGIFANHDELLGLFDRVFLLQCAPAVFLQRIEKRNREAPGNFGWHREQRELLLAVYQDLENQLIAQGAVPIDASQSTEKVAEAILSALS